MATLFIGLNEKVENYINIDINFTPLPFKDLEVDFIYCRHVIEDIENPGYALKEMFRVSKEVYIETPSPMVESSRYIDCEPFRQLR